MLVACYGSLKKGFYNHHALGGDAKFLGNTVVRGAMYWNNSYPKLYHTTGHEGIDGKFDLMYTRPHQLEVYEVNDQAYQHIRAMELGAGYDEQDIKTEWGTAKIYYMPHENFDSSDTWIEAYNEALFTNKN